jgi:peroxiredoxin
LEQIWREYKDEGVIVLGIAIWASEDPFEEAQKFVRKHKLTYPVVVDPEKRGSGSAAPFKVVGVPTNVIVDAEGIVRYYQGGFVEKEIRKALNEVLKQ